MATIVFFYDGGWDANDGSVTATISGGIPGHVYQMQVEDPNSGSGFTPVRVTADGAGHAVITVNNVGRDSYPVGMYDPFCAVVGDHTNNNGVAASVFTPTVPGTGGNPPGLTPTYDGADTFTVTITPDGNGADLFTWQANDDTYDPSGALATFVLTIDWIGLTRTTVHLERYEPLNGRYYDYAAWWVDMGDPTVHQVQTVLSAQFSADPTAGVTPLDVSFTDESTEGPGGAITSWSWDFGDGGSSSVQNPTHTYASSGTYTVSLTVTSPDGSDTKTLTDLVVVIRAGTNTQPTSARTLVGCSSMSYDPTTLPYASSPDLLDDNGWYGRYQAWFKIVNTTSDRAYARLTFTNMGGTDMTIVALAFLSDGSGGFVDVRDNGDVTLISGEFNSTPDDTSGVFNLSAGQSTARGAGVLLDPGQTAYFVVAVDDTSGDANQIQVDFGLNTVTFSDTFDSTISFGAHTELATWPSSVAVKLHLEGIRYRVAG